MFEGYGGEFVRNTGMSCYKNAAVGKSRDSGNTELLAVSGRRNQFERDLRSCQQYPCPSSNSLCTPGRKHLKAKPFHFFPHAWFFSPLLWFLGMLPLTRFLFIEAGNFTMFLVSHLLPYQHSQVFKIWRYPMTLPLFPFLHLVFPSSASLYSKI